MNIIRSRLIKSAQISLGSSKYGIKNAFLLENLNNLLFQDKIVQHKEVLEIFLKKELSNKSDHIIALIKSASCCKDLNSLRSEMESCGFEALKFLLVYATFYGSLVSAEWLRSLYLNRLINEKSANYFFAYDVVLSLLEQGNIESALNFSISRQNFLFKDQMIEVSEFCRYLLGDKNVYPLKNLNQNSKWHNSDFDSTLKTSSILVKGPSNNKVDRSNDYDYVVKTNYILRDEKNISNHILYYNYRKFKSYHLEIKNLTNKVSYVCLKSESQFKQLKGDIPSQNIRKFTNARPIFYRQSGSDPMAVQNIIYDLITSGANNLFLESIDGYSSLKPYDESYQKSDPYSKDLQKSKNIARALRIHDPFSNFSYLKNILNSGRVTADSMASEIFKGKRTDYAKKINSIYGNMHVF